MNKQRTILSTIAALFLTFNSLLITVPANAEEIWWAQENWENDIIPVTAPEGWEFYEIKGWYGDPSDSTCGIDVTELLTSEAKGKTSYTIYANNDTFSDPCVGVYKVFHFTWSIVPLQIVIPDPVIPDPVIPDPVIPDPVIPDPVIPDPVIPDPVVPDPVVPDLPITPPVDPEIPQPPITPEPPTIVPTPPTEPPTTPTTTELLNDLINIPSTEITQAQVIQIQEAAYAMLESNEQGTPQYEQALNALLIAAQADDIQLSEELAAVPVIGAVAEGITNAINFIGNVGADMSPKIREESKKIVISAVVVGQIATVAGMATASANVGGIRKKP